MRLPEITSLCAAILGLLAIAHAFSIHGLKPIRPLPQHLLSERDTAPGALSIELINNFDSDNIHAYIQTTGEGTDQKVLIKADGTQYTPVAKSKYVPTFIPQKTDCRRFGNCQVGLCLSGVLRNGGLPKVCRM